MSPGITLRLLWHQATPMGALWPKHAENRSGLIWADMIEGAIQIYDKSLVVNEMASTFGAEATSKIAWFLLLASTYRNATKSQRL